MKNRYPDFLCIGAQKAGTTWLYAKLKDHPDIWLPDRKEIHYFDLRYPPYSPYPDNYSYSSKGQDESKDYIRKKIERIKHYTPAHLLWELHYRKGRRGDKWYRRLFTPARNRLTGDFTPAYAMIGDHAIKHAHSLMPDTKVIYIMRDPIERAWSHAKMILGKHGARKASGISPDEFISFLESEPSLKRGQYIETVDRWRKYYPDNQFLPIFFDDIVANPTDLISKTLNFIGPLKITEEIKQTAGSAVHKGQELDIPDEVYRCLFRLYAPQMQELVLKFGETPKKWLDKAQDHINTIAV